MKIRSATEGIKNRNQAEGMRLSLVPDIRLSAVCDGSPINSLAWN